MQRNRSLISLALVAAVAFAATLPALAAIGAGTELVGTISRGFNSKDAQVGDTFTITDAHSHNYDINGATIYGHVAKVQRAGQGTPGKIVLEIDKINTRSGNIYKTDAYVSNVQTNTKNNTGKEAGAAAAGALVGALLGKGLGAVIGGAGGFLLAKNNRENVSIPSNAVVTVHISAARRQAGVPH